MIRIAYTPTAGGEGTRHLGLVGGVEVDVPRYDHTPLNELGTEEEVGEALATRAWAVIENPNSKIAGELYMSVATVKSHMSNESLRLMRPPFP